MPLIYRHQKGAALSIEEMDGNFRSLEARIENLEQGPLLAEGIGSITQRGDQLHIQGTHGSDWGVFKLPRIMPCFRGVWAAEQDYDLANFVEYNHAFYLCLITHVSTASWEQDLAAGCWQPMGMPLPLPQGER